MIISDSFDGIFYGENVDKEVEKYMDILLDYTNGVPYKPSKYLPERVKIPHGFNIPLYSASGEDYSEQILKLPRDKANEIIKFWNTQFDRISNGHQKGDGFCCGLEYKYFNFTKLQGHDGGFVDFRRFDNDLNEIMENCLYRDLQGTGLFLMGRRQLGKTSISINAAEDVMSNEQNKLLMCTSKTEDDAKDVIIAQKMKFILRNRPLPLRSKQLKSRSTSEVHFGIMTENALGDKEVGGKNMRLVAKAPVPQSLEGNKIRFWFHDEGPITRNLKLLTYKTLPALTGKDGITRKGFFIIAGVAGEFGKYGYDYVDLWNEADELNALRYFVPGWYGLFADKYGNEDVRKGVRYILTERHKVFTNKRLTPAHREERLMKLQQQYPLTIQESFQSEGSSKWDSVKLNGQVNYLNNNPPVIYSSNIKWHIPKTTVINQPVRNGKFLYIEPPQKGAKYTAGGDVYGLKQKDTGSIGATWIFKLKNQDLDPTSELYVKQQILEAKMKNDADEVMKLYLKLGHLPVGMYLEDHPNPEVYAQNTVKFLYWYWRESGQLQPVKYLPETEPSNVLGYLQKEFKNILAPHPLRFDRVLTKKEMESFGVIKKEYFVEQAFQHITHYIENYVDRIFWLDLLKNMMRYDETDQKKKYDDVDGFGNTLIQVNDPRTIKWNTKIIVPEESGDIKPLINFRRIESQNLNKASAGRGRLNNTAGNNHSGIVLR